MFEAKLAPALLAAGAEYEKERLEYKLDRVYKPDWSTRALVIIELKGYFPAADRAKMRAVKAAHPDRDIRIVFQNPNAKLTKKSKTTYAQWAVKHGFPWSNGVVPASWLQ